MQSLLLFSLFVVSVSAHLCLIEPKQRGTMEDLNTAGAKDCFLLDDPCGKRVAETPMTTFTKGTNVTIVFQKNLDHFSPVKPGAFDVYLWYGDPAQVHPLTAVNDSPDAKSGYLYTPTIIILNDVPTGAAILQVVYMTNNPQAPPYFYQCADVMVK